MPGAEAPEQAEALRGVVLGRRAAEYLGLDLGDVLTLVQDEYEVVGIYASALPMLDAGAMLSFADAQLETGLEDKLNSVLVRIEQRDEAEVLHFAEELEAAFASVEASLPAPSPTASRSSTWPRTWSRSSRSWPC